MRNIKLFLILFSILLLSSSIVSAGFFDWITGKVTDGSCTDSDGGKDYFVKGTADNLANGVGSYYEDRCLSLDLINGVNYYNRVSECDGSNCNLQEGFCNGDSVSNLPYHCPNGCRDGACVKDVVDEENLIRGLLEEGSTKVYTLNNKDYQITVDFVDSNSGKFSINGYKTRDLLFGEVEILPDGTALKILSIEYQAFAGGLKKVEFTLSSSADFQCIIESDCASKTNNYCDDSDACTTLSAFRCESNQCVSSGGGKSCKACANGCSNGACIEDSDACTTVADCPSGTKKYCSGDSACSSISSYRCDSGKCVQYAGGGGCSICPYGCDDGACKLSGTEDCTKLDLRDTDGDGCHSGTDSDCGGIEGVDDVRISCFDGIDNDCDGMVDKDDNDLSCNLDCGDGICGWHEKITTSAYYCPTDCKIGCTDSDGGKNYYVQGYMIDSNGKKVTEQCRSDGRLGEYYCSSDGIGSTYEAYTCPNGCQDGACIKSKITPIPYQDSDLSNYPNMFIVDNKFNGVLVVGDRAPADDVISLVDIAASLEYRGEETSTVTTVEKISVGSAKLASEVRDPLKLNVISVGGPCMNAVTNTLMGHPADCSKGFTKGKGSITLFNYNGFAQVVVAGYSVDDTRNAARVLSNWKDYNLEGKEICVYGTTTDPYIGECAEKTILFPSKCTLPGGLACMDFKVVPSTVNIIIRNGLGFDLELNSIEIPSGNCILKINKEFRNGDQYNAEIVGCNNGQVGSTLESNVIIVYTNSGTGLQHKSIGSLTSRIVEEPKSCTDSDGGINYFEKGYVEMVGDPTFGTNRTAYATFAIIGNTFITILTAFFIWFLL